MGGLRRLSGRGLNESQLRQRLRRSVVLLRYGGMQSGHAPLGDELVERDALGFEIGHVAQVEYGDVGAFAGILQRERRDDGVARVGRDVAAFNRFGDDVVDDLAVAEADDQLIQRLSELHALAHRQSPLLMNQASGSDDVMRRGAAHTAVVPVVLEADWRLLEKASAISSAARDAALTTVSTTSPTMSSSTRNSVEIFCSNGSAAKAFLTASA